MSHSAFRILANDEPINRNLVIVVNKNGQVSTDTEVLQTLLSEFSGMDNNVLELNSNENLFCIYAFCSHKRRRKHRNQHSTRNLADAEHFR